MHFFRKPAENLPNLVAFSTYHAFDDKKFTKLDKSAGRGTLEGELIQSGPHLIKLTENSQTELKTFTPKQCIRLQ